MKWSERIQIYIRQLYWIYLIDKDQMNDVIVDPHHPASFYNSGEKQNGDKSVQEFINDDWQ